MAIDVTNMNAAGNGGNRLAAWDIHIVQLKSVEIEHGEKDGKPWHAMKFTFGNENGEFSQSFFCPILSEDPECTARKKFEGSQYPSPSKEENFVTAILHMSRITPPKKGADGTEKSGEQRFKEFYAKNDPIVSLQAFNKFATVVSKLFAEVIASGTELQLKLISDKNGRYARLPNYCGLRKDGTTYINPFLALATDKKLTFSQSEIKFKNQVESNASKPSSAPEDDTQDYSNSAASTISDEEYDSI